MTPGELEALKKEWQACDDEIQAAYWRFCRMARAKPPSMVCPQAYVRRAEIDLLLRGSDAR